MQVKFQPHWFFEDQVVRVFPDIFIAEAVAGEGRRLFTGDPETRVGTAGFAVLDLGVDLAPTRVGIEVEVFAAPVEGLGDDGADFVAVDRDETVGWEFGQRERAKIGEVA